MGYFGIPFRNGVPIGLGSVVSFGAQQFDPSELFVGGTAGAWYDPSDLTTLFTTSAGTTQCAMPGQGSAVSVGRMLDKSGNGNHAIAFNDTTARPELRARVNLLTYSEQFDNAVWTKIVLNTTGTPAWINAAVAPNGATTADLLLDTTTNAEHYAQQSFSCISGVSYTFSGYVKQYTYTTCVIRTWLTGSVVHNVDFSAGTISGGGTLTNVGNGWFRFEITRTASASGTAYLESYVKQTGAYAGTGTDGHYVWGFDVRPANIGANVPAYQRIADANTYDTSGFPLYLRFDGIDDSMYTPANLNLSSTDKVAVFAGVRKLSDAAQGVVAELSATIASNNGTFLLAAPDGATQTYGWDSKGTTQVDAVASSLAAPRTNVLVGTADIAGDSCIIRVNGAVADTEAGDQGTGNYGTYPLFIGARNNASIWFNGHLHSLIIAGSAVSAGNISATEQWVANKTGIVIP